MTDINWTPQDTYYVYNADTYCKDCGHRIQRELLIKRWNILSIDEWFTSDLDKTHGIEVFNDSMNFVDSNSWPQSVLALQGETDSPDHCGNIYCQRFLGIPLTSDGILYVQESASEDLERDGKVGDTVQGWLDYYGIEEVASNE